MLIKLSFRQKIDNFVICLREQGTGTNCELFIPPIPITPTSPIPNPHYPLSPKDPPTSPIPNPLSRCVIYWYNGKFIQSQGIELNINDPGLLYGATIFTTMRVYENSLDSRLTHWLLHCDRLLFSLKTFGWQQPDWNRVRQGAEILLLHFPILRITLFPDGREWITGRLLPEDLTEKQTNGIICAVVNAEYDRSLASHKTGNYLSAWLARTNSQQLAAQEAILVDGAGNWLETSTGNLWGWRDGCWWTPPLAVGILPGIVLSQLVKWLQSQQQQVQQESWTMELVKEFEAIAYTNSVVEILPIHTVQQPTGSLQYNPHHPSLQILRSFF